MRTLTTTLFLTALSVSSFAQLDSPSAMFWNNPTVYNPAATGLNYQHQATVNYRTQFNRNTGNPQTLNAAYNARVKALHGGIGINYTMDYLDFSQKNKVNLNYAYHLDIGENYTFSAGASAGIINIAERPGKLGLPLLPQYLTVFTSNLGVMLKNRSFTVGLSTTQLNGPDMGVVLNPSRRNYHASADYRLRVNRKFDLIPQLLYTTDFDFHCLNVNLLANYDKFWAGAGYRTQGTFAFMAGYDIVRKFRIGYACELSKSKLNNGVTGLTHEFSLNYLVHKKPKFKTIVTPAF